MNFISQDFFNDINDSHLENFFLSMTAYFSIVKKYMEVVDEKLSELFRMKIFKTKGAF